MTWYFLNNPIFVHKNRYENSSVENMPRTARQRAFLYAATAFATISLLYENSEHHVPVVQRAIRRYRRRYELEVMRGYSDSMINNMQLGDGVRFYG